MTTIIFQRTNPDGTIEKFVEYEYVDPEVAEDYCSIRNHNLSLAGVPSKMACFYTV